MAGVDKPVCWPGRDVLDQPHRKFGFLVLILQKQLEGEASTLSPRLEARVVPNMTEFEIRT